MSAHLATRPAPTAIPVNRALATTAPTLRRAASAPLGSRDTYLDVLKAFATIAVVAGHWMVTAFVPSAGALATMSPLAAMPALAWVTMAIQPLTIFFAIGGMTSAASLARAQDRGIAFRTWLGGRCRRLLVPTAVALGLLGATGGVAWLAGAPIGVLKTAAVGCLLPLWFVGVYLVIALVTGVAVAADRRWGWRVPVAMALAVALIDFLRYGQFASSIPGWVGLIAVLPGWLFSYQCGIAALSRPIARGAHRPDGSVSRGRGAALLGLAGLATYGLALLTGYPPTPMGEAVNGRINSHPPTLVVVAAAAMFLAALWLAEPWLRRVLSQRWAVRLVAWLSPQSLSMLCWHQPVLITATSLAIWASSLLGAGPIAGLTSAPTGGAWLLARLALLPALGCVLALVTSAVARVERATARSRQTGRVAVGAGMTTTSPDSAQ